MLSAIFVDRPRLAIVIALVISIAGLLALTAIPIAQYPDIVPPQVSVTTIYPGANSTVVESTVAEVIEAQVVGVDKMLYMKSTSGDDGSYSLTVSFELGTSPDINAVNVNNRVQVALAALPTQWTAPAFPLKSADFEMSMRGWIKRQFGNEVRSQVGGGQGIGGIVQLARVGTESAFAGHGNNAGADAPITSDVLVRAIESKRQAHCLVGW